MALSEYESAHSDNIPWDSFPFNFGLRHTHSVLSSNDRSETKGFDWTYIRNFLQNKKEKVT